MASAGTWRRAAPTVIKFIALTVAAAFVCTAIGRLALCFERRRGVASSAGEAEVRVVIDAGHGGEDGGTSGADGTREKDVNLAVASAVYDMLSASGIGCVMTRTEDKLLYDEYGDLSDYTGKKKIYDLKNRLRRADEHEGAVLVSIHMNAFSSKKYSGLQVYYSPNNPGSATLANLIQSTVRTYIQPENDRETKRAGKSIYLLDRIRSEGVLIECGFLSNDEECRLLNDPAYRQRLALAIASAISEYLASAGKRN